MGQRTVYSIVHGIPTDPPARARALLDQALSVFPLPGPDPNQNRPAHYPPLVRGEREHWGVVYPGSLLMYDNAWQIAREISRATGAVHLELRIQEGDHWDCTLYRVEEVIANFSTRVRYFDENPPAYPWKAGNLEAFAGGWGIAPERVAPYLIDWDSLDEPRKVHPDDQCETGDFCQVFDFMRTLGISPEPGVHPGLFRFVEPGWVMAPRT